MFRNNDEVLALITNCLSKKTFSEIEVKIKMPNGDEVEIELKGDSLPKGKPSKPWVSNDVLVKRINSAPSLR